MAVPASNINHILSAIPHLQRGPGGVAAVLENGEVVAKRTWGYADLDRRIPMTTATVFPICSISKQMVCLVMVSLLRSPTPLMAKRKEDPQQQMDIELRKLLPHLFKKDDAGGLTVEDLSNMQSGIRDYWAMTTLWGAKPDDPFSMVRDADKALDRTKSLHFAPGTEHSYSNVNFHLLGRILENVSGYSLAQLLVERLFIPAGMSTAALCPNTNGLPLPICGYEGNEKVGYFRATNRIEWAGDAGIAASLDDMIAYEQYLDRSWSDPHSLYAYTSQQQHFKDGTPAPYGYGLGRSQVAGKLAIGHGGALRGFRLKRVHIPSERISVVVLLNHEAEAGGAVNYIAKRVLNWQEPKGPQSIPAAKWKGDYLDEKTQLYVTISDGEKRGTLSVRYAPNADTVKLSSEVQAASETMTIRIEGEGEGEGKGDIIHASRVDENRVLRATRIPKPDDASLYDAPSSDYTGTYRCAESESTLHCTGEHGTLYGSFDGFLGQGPVWLMRYIGEDVWALGNPRGLDATPPGDWTVVFKRGDEGKVEGCTVGCWLARHVEYTKQS